MPRTGYLLVVLSTVMVVGWMATDMYLASLPTIARELRVGVAGAQATIGVYMISFALAQLVYGPVSDRFGRRRPLIVGTAVFIVVSLAITAIETIADLLVLRFLQALGGAAGGVICLAIVRDLYDREAAASMLARIGTIIAAAPAIAPVLGGLMLTAFGWRANFVFLAAFGLLGLILAVISVKETNVRPDPHALDVGALLRNYGRLLRDRTYVGYGGTMMLAFSTFFAFLFASPFVFIEVLHFAPDEFPFMISIQVGGFLSGTLLVDRLLPKVGLERLFRGSLVLALAAGLAAAIFPVLGIVTAATIVGPMTVFAFAMGFVFPLGTAAAMAPFPTIAGSASALLAFSQSSFGALVGVLVGILHDGSVLPMTTTMGAAITLAVTVFVTLVGWRPRNAAAFAD
ncbi:MAG: multidrug effflux MFS transporter [Alphaproteobacteria bacterium]|nr:multidrug effflux MFS transporter [Alphaproteobacteria bacterium]